MTVKKQAVLWNGFVVIDQGQYKNFTMMLGLPQKQSMAAVLCDRPVPYEAVSQHPLQLLWL